MSNRYRLMPTPEQEIVLREYCAHARFVWNLAVEQQSWWRPGRGRAPGWNERSRQLTEARAEFDWLRTGPAVVQHQALRDFDQAMAAFFDKNTPARKPSWRKAGRSEGFRIAGQRGGGRHSGWDVRRVSRNAGEVRIPKLGWVRFRWSQPIPADAKSYRVAMDGARRWHVSFPVSPPAIDRQSTGAVVGIDRGVRTALVTSDGQHYRVPRISDRHTARYLTLQRRMARQRKGSSRREKTRLAMARISAHVADRRKDWTEKVSTRLVADHDVIVFEKLNTARMVRRPKPKPDQEQPGGYLPNGAGVKAALNRGILASCWGALAARTEQKAAASGASAIYVDPKHTSQQCRVCGHIASASRESQAVFRCVSCGHGDHADANAAKNVLARGLASMAIPAHAPGHGAYARISLRKQQREPLGRRFRQPPGNLTSLRSGGCQARQKWIGGEPSSPFEAGLFALFDLNHEAAS